MADSAIRTPTRGMRTTNVKNNHTKHAAEVDLPISGLLTDLNARGLLDSTLVVWQGEFGRMPISQRGVGRDHNPGAMSMWMAGREDQGRPDHRLERRVRVQSGGAADLGTRSPCDDSAFAGARSYQADLSLQWARHAADGCLRRGHSADRENLEQDPPYTARFGFDSKFSGQELCDDFSVGEGMQCWLDCV